MADSENSRTLPSNRYRNLLSATERLLSELTVKECGENNGDANETLSKWASWLLAHSECSRLCSFQQRLESELFKTAAKQAIDSLPTYQASTSPIEAPDDIAILDERDASRDRSSGAKAELDVRGRQREAKDEAVSHQLAKVAEDAASAREQMLAEEVWLVSGRSAVSAMAKLHCVLEHGEPVPHSGEFPWPQIRSALADLLTASAPGPAIFRDHRECHSAASLS